MMLCPGAATSTHEPQLEKDAFWIDWLTAATPTTPG